MNTVMFQGRLTRDPQISETGKGIKRAGFSIAVDRPYTDGGQRVADYIDCTAWRGQAEFIEAHFTKGKGIIVQGALRVSSYTDQSGQKRKSWEIVVDKVFFPMGSRDLSAAPAQETPDAQPAAVGAGESSDEDSPDYDPFAEC